MQTSNAWIAAPRKTKFVRQLSGGPVKISYDAEIDALYIRLLDGPCECRTVRLNEEIALNIGPAEKLVGIEILDAKRVLGEGQVPSLVLENLAVASS